MIGFGVSGTAGHASDKGCNGPYRGSDLLLQGLGNRRNTQLFRYIKRSHELRVPARYGGQHNQYGHDKGVFQPFGDISRGDGAGVKGQRYAFQLQLQWFREHLSMGSAFTAAEWIDTFLRPILAPITPMPLPGPVPSPIQGSASR